MKLLTELTHEVEYLKEGKEGSPQKLYIRGPFAEAEVGNRNKRWYPLPILEREFNRYQTENISKNNALGELNHPAGPNINLDRVAIKITEAKRDGNKFIGKALVTETPMGDIVKGLINSGVQLGVSTRALGSLKYNSRTELNEVQDDLKLLAVDVVSDPSCPSAYVSGLHEGAEWIFNPALGSWVINTVETHKKVIKEVSRKKITQIQTRLFEEFLSSLKNPKS
jgi:hypothetical protein